MDTESLIKNCQDYAQKSGFSLNPKKEVVKGIVSGLLKNEEKYGQRYCPCRRVTGNEKEDKKNICPCVYHKDEIAKDGHCLCGLFIR